jgi:GTP cyclohydrolase FolE2
VLLKKKFSHTQKGLVKITAISDQKNNYSFLLSSIEKYCQLVSTTLKHTDEVKFVEESYKKAAFCEDIARLILADLKQRYKQVYSEPSTLKFLVKVKSNESIHPFYITAYAEQIIK